jgi:DOPA 4,5-dioxygenase
VTAGEAAPASIAGYHAHIYYDEETRPVAARIREAIAARFDVGLGRWRDAPVGPHPRAMYQVAFAPEVFAGLVPWLMVNHQGLSVFIHPRTGDDVPDHSEFALWLGEKLDLDLSVL